MCVQFAHAAHFIYVGTVASIMHWRNVNVDYECVQGPFDLQRVFSIETTMSQWRDVVSIRKRPTWAAFDWVRIKFTHTSSDVVALYTLTELSLYVRRRSFRFHVLLPHVFVVRRTTNCLLNYCNDYITPCYDHCWRVLEFVVCVPHPTWLVWANHYVNYAHAFYFSFQSCCFA